MDLTLPTWEGRGDWLYSRILVARRIPAESHTKVLFRDEEVGGTHITSSFILILLQDSTPERVRRGWSLLHRW
jgi:hypothetical protein